MSEREQKCIQMRCGDSIVRGMYLDELLALRAKVERLEGDRLRLREVVSGLNVDGDPDPTLGSYCVRCGRWSNEPPGKRLHHDDCQLAAVLRETEANTETGRE